MPILARQAIDLMRLKGWQAEAAIAEQQYGRGYRFLPPDYLDVEIAELVRKANREMQTPIHPEMEA